MEEEEAYHLSPKALLGEHGHNEVARYMGTLKKAWKLPKNQAVAMMLAPDGKGLVFCALQTSGE
jgi:hypothetical protein